MILDSHIIHTNRTLELGSFLVRNRFRNNHKSFKEVVAEIKGLFETVPKSNYNTWDSEIQGITGAFRLGRECIICGDSDKRNHYQIVINYKYGVTGYCCQDCVEYDQDPEDLCISTEKRVIKIMKYLNHRRYQPEQYMTPMRKLVIRKMSRIARLVIRIQKKSPNRNQNRNQSRNQMEKLVIWI